MTQIEAHQKLIRFLTISYKKNLKAVLVITGKGLKADGGTGVLRQIVPEWLNEIPVREFIKAFDHASPGDGGEGALYVLLRRSK